MEMNVKNFPRNIWTHTFLCLVFFSGVVHGYPSGAGLTACKTLQPDHKEALKPSEYTSPYSVQVVDDIRTYSPKKPIRVKVTSASLPWQGIFLQARKYNASGPALGYWEVPDEATNTRTMKCDKDDDTITHKNSAAKSTVEFTWNPPKRNHGNIIFTGVIARNKNMWWNDQESFILIPVDYIETTTTQSTVGSTNSTTQEVTVPRRESTRTPPRDGQDEDTDYPEESAACRQMGIPATLMLLMITSVVSFSV